MLTYRMSKDTPMTPQRMGAYIADFKTKELPRMKKLYDYYVGRQKITRRTGPEGKPNNKAVHPYGNYITDINVGYFLGEAIAYSSSVPDESLEAKSGALQRAAEAVRDALKKAIATVTGKGLLDTLQEINKYNDEAAGNAELGTDASIFGIAEELVYIDKDSAIRFTPIDPRGVVLIFDDTVESELLYGIRFWENVDILTRVHTEYAVLYSDIQCQTYRHEGGLWAAEGEPVEHHIGAVPINPYYNNRMGLGDYEQILSLIDAYDATQSDSINDVEAFADAYLALIGMGDISFEPDDQNKPSEGEQAIRTMKNNRVLLIPEGGDAKWVVKTVNDTQQENLKTRLAADIHKFSKTPALTDQDFAANASGVAIKYKLMGLETVAAKKERAFRKGLQRRIELICNVLSIKGRTYRYTDITMTFKRNIPANFTEIADVLNKVGTLLSKETQVGLLPVETTYAEERERIKAEAEDGYSVPTADGE
ncbi:MAG: phage portal protein [Clostridiaceae bacterium]